MEPLAIVLEPGDRVLEHVSHDVQVMRRLDAQTVRLASTRPERLGDCCLKRFGAEYWGHCSSHCDREIFHVRGTDYQVSYLAASDEWGRVRAFANLVEKASGYRLLSERHDLIHWERELQEGDHQHRLPHEAIDTACHGVWEWHGGFDIPFKDRKFVQKQAPTVRPAWAGSHGHRYYVARDLVEAALKFAAPRERRQCAYCGNRRVPMERVGRLLFCRSLTGGYGCWGACWAAWCRREARREARRKEERRWIRQARCQLQEARAWLKTHGEGA